MKRFAYKKAISLIILTITIAMLSGICIIAEGAPEEHIASEEFSGTQGNNNWFYGYIKSGASFEQCEKYNSSRGIWTSSNFANASIAKTTISPGTGGITARKWVATNTGNITLTSIGNVRKQENAVGGDGILIYIYKNNELIYENSINGDDTIGISYELTQSIVKNDAIYFAVAFKGAAGYGATVWEPKITYLPKEQEPILLQFVGSEQFSTTTQGKNSWFYGYKKAGEAFVECKYYNAGLGVWKSDDCINAGVGMKVMHPGDDGEAVRKWVAPKSGKVILTSNGNIRKDSGSVNGDGILVYIYHNGEKIYNNSLAGNDATGFEYEIELSIKTGDVLYFAIENKGGIGYGTTCWDPVISYLSLIDVDNIDEIDKQNIKITQSISDSNGVSVESLNANEVLTINVRITPKTALNSTCAVGLFLLNKNGFIEDASVYTEKLMSQDKSFNFNYTLPSDIKGKMLKLYVWQDVENLKGYLMNTID